MAPGGRSFAGRVLNKRCLILDISTNVRHNIIILELHAGCTKINATCRVYDVIADPDMRAETKREALSNVKGFL